MNIFFGVDEATLLNTTLIPTEPGVDLGTAALPFNAVYVGTTNSDTINTTNLNVTGATTGIIDDSLTEAGKTWSSQKIDSLTLFDPTNFTSHIIPASDVLYDIGNSTQRIRTTYSDEVKTRNVDGNGDNLVLQSAGHVIQIAPNNEDVFVNHDFFVGNNVQITEDMSCHNGTVTQNLQVNGITNVATLNVTGSTTGLINDSTTTTGKTWSSSKITTFVGTPFNPSNITTNLVPDTDNSRDLGTTLKRMRTTYSATVEGTTVNTTTVNTTNLNVTGTTTGIFDPLKTSIVPDVDILRDVGSAVKRIRAHYVETVNASVATITSSVTTPYIEVAGNADVAGGNLTVTTGNLTVSAGNLTTSAGNFTLSAGAFIAPTMPFLQAVSTNQPLIVTVANVAQLVSVNCSTIQAIGMTCNATTGQVSITNTRTRTYRYHIRVSVECVNPANYIIFASKNGSLVIGTQATAEVKVPSAANGTFSLSIIDCLPTTGAGTTLQLGIRCTTAITLQIKNMQIYVEGLPL